MITLDRQEVCEKIRHGANADGAYYLAVNPEADAYRIYWYAEQAPWAPWPKGWQAIRVPSLYQPGEGDEIDLAREALYQALGEREFNRLEAAAMWGNFDWVETARERAPEALRAREQAQVDFLADAFLAACNGDGSDLGEDAPWGTDEYGQPLPPPAEFEWA